MTERGLPIADAAPACPFVAFDDQRDDRSDRPDPRHRCYAESPPSPRARAHQEAYCLSANFPVCPTFQDWARREAARVLPVAGAGSPAERLRDVPAQRVAGERPPAFGASPAEPDVFVPPTTSGRPPGSFLERVIEREGEQDDTDGGTAPIPIDAAAAPDEAEDAGPGRMPWDLPARRPVQPDWSAPPPWAATRAGAPAPAASDADEVDAPDFLRAAPERAPRDEGRWSRPAEEEPEDETAAGAADRDATMARLRAMGMGADEGAGLAAADDRDDRLPPRPATSVGRPVSAAADEEAFFGRPSVPPSGGRAGAGAGGVAAGAGPAGSRGTIDAVPAAEPGGRPSGGLARILGWDRRPRAGSTRAPRQPQKEPSWERPRRYEAYPTLKTRVGLPVPSRLWLAAGAVLVAAALLFFVPPLFLKQSGGTGTPGATRTPAASGSGAPVASPSRSVGPTAKPSPTQLTYTVRQGDTLSSIAKRFKITVEELLAANKQIKNPNKIAIGDVLVIPAPAPSDIVSGESSASP